jgi:hypothetical protein
MGPDTLRVVLDRVLLRPDGRWERSTPITFKDFPTEAVRQMSLADRDLNALGSIVFAELSGALELDGPS